MSSCCLLVRREPFGADAGHPLPAAERDSRDESCGATAEGREHVLHDEAADQIRSVPTALRNSGENFINN